MLRLPFAMPVLVSAVMCLALIGEITYQSAHSNLTSGIQLTDARMDGTKLLQLITDAETAQRGFLLTGHDDYLASFEKAKKQLEDNGYYLQRIGALSGNGPFSVNEIRVLVNENFAEMSRTIDLAQAGNLIQSTQLVQSFTRKSVC